MRIKVGGATAGSLFDQINVSGTATLAGTLAVTLISGYAPGLEESYDVLNFASSTGSIATFNSPLINGNPAFTTNTTPTSLDLVGVTAAPDLAVSSVSFTPAYVFLNQRSRSVHREQPGHGGDHKPELDRFCLSLNRRDARCERRPLVPSRKGPLGAMSHYTDTLTAQVPAVNLGGYHVIVEADSGLQVPDINRANNTAVATAELSVQPPTLALGTTLSGTIANGQDLYYQVAVAPSTSVVLTATFAQAVESEFYVQFGALPTDSSFDQSSTDLNALSPQLQLPSGQGGIFFIWLHGREGAGDGQPFTLAASIVTFARQLQRGNGHKSR